MPRRSVFADLSAKIHITLLSRNFFAQKNRHATHKRGVPENPVLLHSFQLAKVELKVLKLFTVHFEKIVIQYSRNPYKV